MIIDKQAVKKFKVPKDKADLINDNDFKRYLRDPAGVEHYSLLGYLASRFTNSYILDVGTNMGASALALSCEESNSVLSADIDITLNRVTNTPGNVTFMKGDILEDEVHLRSAELILLDTYHDGVFEERFVNKLDEINYSGILVMDDIFLTQQMTEIWDGIKQPKYDMTDVGHGRLSRDGITPGTGIVDYSGKVKVI